MVGADDSTEHFLTLKLEKPTLIKIYHLHPAMVKIFNIQDIETY